MTVGRTLQDHPIGRWTPVVAAGAMLAAVAFAGTRNDASSADATTTVGFTTTSIVDTTTSTLRKNPGEVDASLTVPPSTQPQVVIPTDPAIVKTQLAASIKYKSKGDDVLALQQR